MFDRWEITVIVAMILIFKYFSRKINGVLAAVEATTERALAGRFEVQGYPTSEYTCNVFCKPVKVRKLSKSGRRIKVFKIKKNSLALEKKTWLFVYTK